MSTQFTMVFLPPQDDQSSVLSLRLKGEISANVVVVDSLRDAEEEIVRAEAAYGRLSPLLLSRAQRLKWLQAPSAGPPAGFYFPELVDHPVVVTNFRGIFGSVVPIHALAFILHFARAFHVYRTQQQSRTWNQLQPSAYVHLADANVLVIGVGSIGREIARLCAQVGLGVRGVDTKHSEIDQTAFPIYPPDEMESLLPDADFVVVTVPDTPKTAGLFTARQFALMRTSAFFINVGRGVTARIDDLAAAILAGEIAGAGLDVFETEPLPREHRLWTLENVLLTPHVAAAGCDLNPLRGDILVENARRFANGEQLLNVVDKEQWY